MSSTLLTENEAARPAESAVVHAAVRAAQGELDRATGRAGRLARRIDRLAASAAGLRERAAALRADLMRSPTGAVEGAEQLRRRHDRLDEAITTAQLDGYVHHRRVGRGHRIAARILPWIDALLFGYFISGVSNANLAAPWTTPVASLVALAFTAFLVLTVAAFTPWLGRALRPYKGGDGELRWVALGPGLTGLLGLWAVLTVAIGVTMFVRVQAEAGYAGAEPVTGAVVAALLALASAAMNAYVLAVSFADGSPAADDLRACARVLRRVHRRAARLDRRAARRDRRRVRCERRARRRILRGTVRSGARLAVATAAIDDLRVRAGTSPAPHPLPAPDSLDQRALTAVAEDIAAAPFG